ncbi:4a-hydroxytetrahydrobiopterin dehydratase, partial [Nocardioides sp.]|uniref:4a-hydroxytetrahydrobiopterin dehydratase n=1 Tax=Nocardioides sp. TaxID=35761 RepID=UPI001A1EB15A
MTEPDPTTIIGYPAVRDSGVDDWRWLLGVLHARFRTGSFATGLELADRIGAAADEADHHPDLDLSYP